MVLASPLKDAAMSSNLINTVDGLINIITIMIKMEIPKNHTLISHIVMTNAHSPNPMENMISMRRNLDAPKITIKVRMIITLNI